MSHHSRSPPAIVEPTLTHDLGNDVKYSSYNSTIIRSTRWPHLSIMIGTHLPSKFHQLVITARSLRCSGDRLQILLRVSLSREHVCHLLRPQGVHSPPADHGLFLKGTPQNLPHWFAAGEKHISGSALDQAGRTWCPPHSSCVCRPSSTAAPAQTCCLSGTRSGGPPLARLPRAQPLLLLLQTASQSYCCTCGSCCLAPAAQPWEFPC